MPRRPRSNVNYISTPSGIYEPVPLMYPDGTLPVNIQSNTENYIASTPYVNSILQDSNTIIILDSPFIEDKYKSVIFKIGDTVKYNDTRTKVTGIGKCFCGCDYVTYTLAAVDGEFFGSSLEKCSNFKSITLEYGENK